MEFASNAFDFAKADVGARRTSQFEREVAIPANLYTALRDLIGLGVT